MSSISISTTHRTLTPIRKSACALSVLLAALFCAAPCLAHPSVSVVIDSHGTIFYSDLERVWMIHSDGTKMVAVDNVHTHQLMLDANDNLYGEDVANVGDEYRHRVWRRANDGEISDVLPWRNGYPDDFGDYSFVLDSSGRQYVLNRTNRVVKVVGNNPESISLQDLEGYLHWLAVDSNDNLFLTIGSVVFVRVKNIFQPLATDLIDRTKKFNFVHDRHAIMGLWTDKIGNVFAAIFSGQVVKRVSPNGEVDVVYRSANDWSPTGGLVAPDGTLWVLEFSSNNKVRVTRVSQNGTTKSY